MASPKIVYLDQNKWIQLARLQHRKDHDQAGRTVLEFVSNASAEDIVFPLSAGHYIETAKIANRERRSRLGKFMWDISKGLTFASNSAVVRHEVEEALARRFPAIKPHPFRLISRGVGHALGRHVDPYRIPEPFRSSLDSSVVEVVEECAQELIERSVITGKGPEGIEYPTFGNTKCNWRFKSYLDTLHPGLSQLSPDLWEAGLNALCFFDIQEVLDEVLTTHSLGWPTFLALGKEALMEFTTELPSRVVDIHLQRQMLKNSGLRGTLTDLEDWAWLGMAVAYCDVVVCEKHFADLVLRGGFKPHANVIRDIRELPSLVPRNTQ